MRNARSADKEALRAVGVTGSGQLEAGRGGRSVRGDGRPRGGELARGRGDRRRELREPAGGDRRVQAEELQRGAGDGRGVVVERDRRDGVVVEPARRADDAERDRARRRPRGGAVAGDRVAGGPGGRGGAQRLRAEAARRAATLSPASARATSRSRAAMNGATPSAPRPSATACSRPSECA
jgi:hypothetical protein